MKNTLRIILALTVISIVYLMIRPAFSRKSSDSPDQKIEKTFRSNASQNDHAKGESGHPDDRELNSMSDDVKSMATPDSLTLDKARKLLKDYKSAHPNIYSQAEFAAELTKNLCKNGRAEEAWEFIEPGSGDMRNLQLREFFKNAELSRNELIAKLSAFEFNQDVRRGLDGYLLRVKASEYVNEISSVEIKKLVESLGISPSDALRRAVELAMDEMFGRRDSSRHPPSDATVIEFDDAIKDMESKGLVNRRELILTVMGSGSSSFIKWEILKDYPINAGDFNEDMRRNLITNMITGNPAKTVSEILTSSEPKDGAAVDVMINQWTIVDSGGATKCYADNQSSLSQNQQSLAAAAFSKSALSSSEFVSARQWADQIRDLKQREERLKEISEKQAESLRGSGK